MTPEERAQLQQLVAWMNARQQQQLVTPLDSVSQSIATENIPVVKEIIPGSPTPGGILRVEINGIEHEIITT